MYQEKVNLTPKDILEKEFKIDTRGYRLKEVDEFLDLIISDYEQFNTIIKDANREKEELLDEIMQLKQEIRNLKTSLDIAKTTEVEDKVVSNIDIIKRLSQLEKIVYGKDE